MIHKFTEKMIFLFCNNKKEENVFPEAKEMELAAKGEPGGVFLIPTVSKTLDFSITDHLGRFIFFLILKVVFATRKYLIY